MDFNNLIFNVGKICILISYWIKFKRNKFKRGFN